MQDNEREEGGISIGDIFRTILSCKWLALVIAAVITVGGAVGLYFYGASKQEYSVTFVMYMPGSGNSPVSYTYPDGTRFHFTDLVSVENLQRVKENSAKKEIDEFADVNVDAMVRNGDISIIRELLETAQGSGAFEANYTIKVNSSYFKNREVAKNFIRELVNLPAEHLANMEITYDAYLSSAEEALTYNDRITFLRNQAVYLRNNYDSFITTYTGSFVIKGGKMLTAYRSALDVYISNGEFERLKNEAIKNGYIRSLEDLAEYESKKFEKERQLVMEQAALDNLLSLTPESQSSVIVDADKIISQTKVVKQLEQDIEDLKNYISSKNVNAEFENSVKALEAKVEGFTDEFKSVAAFIYDTVNTVNYSNADIVVAVGGFGILKSVLISLVAGVVIALIAAYIAGYVKQKKTVVKTSSAVTSPVFAEAQAQAAVTKDEDNDENK